MASQLADQVRKKYPGAYDSKTDAEIETAIIKKFPGKYDHLATKKLPENITLPDGSIVSSAYKGGERKDRRIVDTDRLRESMITAASKTSFPRVAGFIGELGVSTLDLVNDPESVATAGMAGGLLKAGTKALPSRMPDVIPPKVIPNITTQAMTGAREILPVKSKVSVSEVPINRRTTRTEAPRIRKHDPAKGREIMEGLNPQAAPIIESSVSATPVPKQGMMSETGALNVTLPSAPQIYVPKGGLSVTDVVNTPKALGAALDVSFPGRQGLWMVGRPQWAKSWAPMMKSLFSEKSYRKLQDSITQHPKFTEAVNNGLSLTDFAGVAVPKGMKTKAIGRLSQQEEQFGTRIVEQFTGSKYSPFRASNRAYSAFANNFRMSTYSDLTDKATRIAQKGGPIADRKMIAEYINTGSGRGSMGLTVGGKSETLEKASDLLNTVFWSPRFLASRAQLLNVPGNLIKMDKFTRQEYLRDMITSVVGGSSVLGIAHLAGTEVDLNPLSPDFAKIKVGNTRYDATQGFGPMIRFIAQGVNGILDISEKDASGPSAWKFVESKLQPATRWMKEIWTGKNYFERDITPGQASANLVTPLIAKDFYEIYQNDPSLFPLGGIPALAGISVQSYKDRNKGKMPSLSTSFPKMPSISGS